MTIKDFSREKIYVKKTIFIIGENTTYTWKEIKDLNFDDNDEIVINSAKVTRTALETDEELERRLNQLEEDERLYNEKLNKQPQKKVEKSAGLKRLRRG